MYIGCTLATMLSPRVSAIWLWAYASTETFSSAGLRVKASSTRPRMVMLSMLLPVENTYSKLGRKLPSLKSAMAFLNWKR